MKTLISILFFTVFLCNSSPSLLGQAYYEEAPKIRVKTGLPNIFEVDNVRQISDSESESILSLSVSLKKGKILSVGRDGGFWVITVRTSSKSASTYVVSEKKFRIIGEESKKVIIHAIHWKDGK
ncbi:MAG: hypothetical protein MRJ65_13040 [Candidatus Brocadiaceae bacterium]|nr:hypothetical protein [Candidatus Brocadiaceae bacterium]